MSSSANSTSPWIWSDEHRRYFMYIYRLNGEVIDYQWADQVPSNVATQQKHYDTGTASHTDSTMHTGTDSASNHVAEMAPPAPANVMHNIRWKGTPERGWRETLDPRYCMRTDREAQTFFVQGRVFAMLWSETASATMARNGTENTAVTVGLFGEKVYSQIRRFVIVKVNRQSNFVYACPIFTYGNKGTMKYGCTASQHTIVYLTGSHPTYLKGEKERGMTKDPIEIVPTDATETMLPASRLRLGKIHSIEWNVKVREIGQVARRHMSKLVKYYREEQKNGYDDDYYSEEAEGSVATLEPVVPINYPQTNQTPQNYPPYQ